MPTRTNITWKHTCTRMAYTIASYERLHLKGTTCPKILCDIASWAGFPLAYTLRYCILKKMGG